MLTGALRLSGCALYYLSVHSIASRTKELHSLPLHGDEGFSRFPDRVAADRAQPNCSTGLRERCMEPSGANAALRAQQAREGQRVDVQRAGGTPLGGTRQQGAAVIWKSYCPLHIPAGTNTLDSYSQPALNQERPAASHAPADGPLPGPSQPHLQPPRGPAAGCVQSRLRSARAAQQSAADGPSTAELLRRRRRQRQLALWKAGPPLPAVQRVSEAGHCVGHIYMSQGSWPLPGAGVTVLPHEAVGLKAGAPGICKALY